jgi:hypothetical protein
MILRALLVLFLAAVIPDVAAVYKWVDEKGVTHYTEEPPPDRKATKVEFKPSAPTSRGADSPDDWKQREYEFRKNRLDKEKAEATEKQRTDRDAAGRRNRCLRARHALDILQSRPVYRTNERGERVFIEDKERAKETEEWREIARENCDTQ